MPGVTPTRYDTVARLGDKETSQSRDQLPSVSHFFERARRGTLARERRMLSATAYY